MPDEEGKLVFLTNSEIRNCSKALSIPLRSIFKTFVLFTLLVLVASSISADYPGEPDQANPSQLSLSTELLDFGLVEIGSTTTRILTLRHSGPLDSETIEIIGVSMDELDSVYFSADFQESITLYPGESTSFPVDLTADASGDVTGTIHSNLFISHTGATNISLIRMSGQIGSDTLPVQSRATTSTSFGKSTVDGIASNKPTSLQFGPDGRLYVADMLGKINIYNVQRFGPNDYSVVATETLHHISNIPNHNDDGTHNPGINSRLVTGLLVTGTSDNPVIYVTSSDPRIGGGQTFNDTNLDTNSTIVSRLKWNGNSWIKLDLVRGLPRSEENHHGNGMALSVDGDTLYLAMGGNTNSGAMSNNFAMLPEYALSAAILQIDLQTIGDSTYDLPTLDDEDRVGINDFNDPFGGNQGKNQAMHIAGGPVKVYAPGFRNAYDVVIAKNNKMYSIDNGPNAGWGGTPVNEGPQGNCINAPKEPGNTYHDSLHYITGMGYYAGHANPTRGNNNNKFNTSNPQSPVLQSNPVECDYRVPGSESGALVTFPVSTNGLVEYTASNFNNEMKGDLLAVGWNNTVFRIQLNQSGTQVELASSLFSTVGVVPLDVTAQDDTDIYPGTIWVTDFVGNKIIVFEPVDYANNQPGSCSAISNGADEDSDGFTNEDEIAAGTDPCSAADLPPDFDGDFVSDFVDTDDDNDNIDDIHDPFALDPYNGANTQVPLLYDWENGSQSPGGISNLGFTGLMSNGIDDYSSLYDPYQMTTSGAAGVLTIDSIPFGDAFASHNTQQYGFQLGINVSQTSPPFIVHTRILAPFSGITPTNHQSLGMFIGKGDQDNYVKLTANTVGQNGGAQFLKEVNGTGVESQQQPGNIFGSQSVDLYLAVNPAITQVTASYQLTVNGIPGSVIQFPNSFTFPAQWLSGTTRLAVGVISTSANATPFSGTWDLFEVTTMLNDGAGNQAPFVDAKLGGSTNVGEAFSLNGIVSDDGLPNGIINSLWTKQLGPGEVVFSDAFSPLTTANFSSPGEYVLQLLADDGELISSDTTTVTVTTTDPSNTATVVYRVNVGGPAISDPLGDWMSDTEASQFVNTGIPYKTSASIDLSKIDNTVSEAVFQTSRWDPSSGPEMHWSLPVIPGEYEVSLYFAEIWTGAHADGVRVFSANVEGTQLTDIDVFAETGGNTALVYRTSVTTDEYIDIEFQHIIENPSIKGIEVRAISSTGNSAPIVNAGQNQSTLVDVPIVLSAIVNDDGLPDGNLQIQWSKFSGPDVVTFSDPANADTTAIFPQPGSYTLLLTASDGELTNDDKIVVTVANDTNPDATTTLRINVGGPFISDPTGNWLADASVKQYVNTGIFHTNTVAIDLSNLDKPVPAAIFQTSRWDALPQPEMTWSLPVEPGNYEVRLYFAEIWSGAYANGARVFSATVEGLKSNDIDVFAAVGSNAATVYSVTVTADDSIDIEFHHLVENPSIKAIEIVPLGTGTVTNSGPTVNAGTDKVTQPGNALSLNAQAHDDGLPNGVLNLSWSKQTGPGSVVFEDTSSRNTIATFSVPGFYKLRLTANDGELSTFDEVGITVEEGSNPQLRSVIRINVGGQTVASAGGNWISDELAQGFVNTGITHSNSVPIDLSGISGSVPEAVFQSSRWDTSAAPEMHWAIPVQAGVYEIRLYFSEIWSGAYDVGKRVFAVNVEGTQSEDIDVFAAVGENAGFMYSTTVDTDDFIDIEFMHIVENPSLKGIEIIPLGS